MEARDQPRFKVRAKVFATKGVIDLRFEPRQWPPRIVPHRTFVHHTHHSTVVHPVLLHTDALQFAMGFNVVPLKQGCGIFRPQVPAAQSKVGRSLPQSGFFDDFGDAVFVHGHHAEGGCFLTADPHQSGHRSTGSSVNLDEVP